jgi:uncharacterized protein (TIGR02588 family)
MPKSTMTARTPLLEWIASGLGLVLLLVLIGVIGREALTGETDAPPAIEIRATSVAKAGSGYVVAIEAVNRSGGTAASVQIEGVLSDGGAPIETSSATLDYVPGHSTRSGGLFFREDPRRHRLELRALGFQTP